MRYMFACFFLYARRARALGNKSLTIAKNVVIG